MGSASAFAPERLVIGILASPEAGPADREALGRELEESFGGYEPGPELPFAWSGYYDSEMGGRPSRAFASFSRLVDPSTLPSIKSRTNALEQGLARAGGGRLFNLDPGILSLSSFVLATTKARPHRIPLGEGIYGELTLMYGEGGYRSLPWTYPDWASEEYRAYLGSLRSELKLELRAALGGAPAAAPRARP
jgi:hypothetical protein